MADKRKISAAETYVLDDDEVEELDQMSLTGVLRDVTGAVSQIENESEPAEDEDDELDFSQLGSLVSDD
jgi:hypothetical protein